MNIWFIIGIIAFVMLLILGNILLLKSNTQFSSSLTEKNKDDEQSDK